MDKIIILILACCLSLMGCSSPEMKYPDANSEKVEYVTAADKDATDVDEVETVQFNVIKIPAEQMNKESRENLLKKLFQPDKGAVVYGLKRDDTYHTVCLYGKNGNKRVFHFYKASDNWYMETQDGTVYKNAEFITDYIGTLPYSSETIGFASVSIDKSWLEYDDLFEKHDLNYLFYAKAREFAARGCSEDEAIERTKDTLKKNQLLLHYAKKTGHGATEEMIEARIQSLADAMGQTEEVERYLSRSWDAVSADCAIESLWKTMRNSYRNGDDTIGDTECDTFEDYWTHFLEDVVYPGADDDELNEIDSQLSLAEMRYKQLTEGLSVK